MRLVGTMPAMRTASLAEDHQLAAHLIEHLVVPTIVTNAEHKVVIWNNACERLTGVPASRVLGTSDQWKAFYLKPRPCLADLIIDGRHEEISAHYSSWSKFGLSEFGVSVENWCDLRHAGRRSYLAIDAGPVFDVEGRLYAVVASLRDITAQKEAQDALRSLAALDSLTGLANRRTFDTALEVEAQRCNRSGAPLSLLMMDIDHFKSFNDHYGHCGGDACLKRVASAIAGSVLRAGDLAARYGGEEFAVILPDTDLPGAQAIGERLREAVEDLKIRHGALSAGPVVTMSVGGASAVPVDPRTLIAKADAALYAVKRGGRNRSSVVALHDRLDGRHLGRPRDEVVDCLREKGWILTRWGNPQSRLI